MNFPFVMRSRYEFAERHIKLLKAMLAESVDDRKTQDQRYDELVKTIVGMKKEGFESPPEIIELVPEKELPSKVWEAINDVSVKNTREYYTNMAYAHEALESGKPEDEVVHHIIYGQEVDV